MRLVALAVLIAVLVGCSGRASVPVAAPPADPAPPKAVDSPPAAPAVRAVGDDLEVTGFKYLGWLVWSPAGSQALLTVDNRVYLLGPAGPSLTLISEFLPIEPVTFWSEQEVVWQRDGRLQVRDLITGQDRLLHDFRTHGIIHFLRPGDTHYVVNREQGVVQQGYRFGSIVAGKLGGQEERVLIELGHLIGRMKGGQVLAVEGYRGGPLWSLSGTGEKTLLSKDPAYFVQVSPDGGRALWLTGPAPKTSWLNLFGPAVAHADGPYDPPLSDLWTWDGAGAPTRIPLGSTLSARAEFSPDGARIALALNEAFIGPEMREKPGRLAVVEGGKIRRLATYEGWVGMGPWLGSDGFRVMPPVEKTGAQAPILKLDLGGKESTFSGGIWDQAGTREGQHLIVDWKGEVTTVHWNRSAASAQVRFSPNDHLGHPVYVEPSAPYLPFASEGRLRLVPLKLQ